MVRQRQSLDGQWQFAFDHSSQLSHDEVKRIEQWRDIRVPMPWQAQFDDLRLSTGTGWYRLRFRVPTAWKQLSVILNFGAVFYHAEVWLNGECLGENANGYLPFEYAIAQQLNFDGENELIVGVTTPSNDHALYPDYPFSEILHGKQSWYGHWGGIWQSVWMETRPLTHIQYVQLMPDVNTRTIACAITCTIMPENTSGQTLNANVIDPDGKRILETSTTINENTVQLALPLDHEPLYWSPDTPHLYRVQLALDNGDTVEKTCGFRTIETRDGQILLNGEPFYMRGVLDQDYYPDTLSTAPSVAFLEDQFRKVKAMGLNTVRYHIKIADPRYYEVADRLGVFLWVDLPNWQNLTERVKSRVKETFQGILKRDGHHPSIGIWTIVNEDWGTNLVHEASHRQWLLETYRWLKSQDTTRLVVDNSACEPNYHVQSDIDDYHFYRAIPDHVDSWDEVIERFANRAEFTYSDQGDSIRTHQEPLIVSEFGNWGLPFPSQIRDESGDDPWWFETGLDWAEGTVYPHGIDQRFSQWHLEQFFGDFDTLIKATQWQQYNALKHEIESIRLKPSLQGYVITELTDLHWECNGLLDMRRNPRVFYDKMPHLNSDVMVIAHPTQFAYLSGETVTISLTLSSVKSVDIASIRWRLSSGGDDHMIDFPAVGYTSIRELNPITFNAPDVQEPTAITIAFEVLAHDGNVIHRNNTEVIVLPETRANDQVFCPDDDLAHKLEQAGYVMHPDAAVWITNRVDAQFQAHIRNGGKGLFLVDMASGLPNYQPNAAIQQLFPYLSISPRENTVWQGDWVSGFGWMHPAIVDLDFPHAPLMGSGYKAIIPDNVLIGATPQDFQHAVLSGLFVGWIHRPVATTIKKHYGEGQVILTTLKLLDAIEQANPLGRFVLQRLLDALK